MYSVYILDDKNYPVVKIADNVDRNKATAIAVEAEEKDNIRCTVRLEEHVI